MSCIFCEIEERYILFETEFFKAVYDIDPMQHGHVIVMTKKHNMHVNELSQNELNEYIIVQKKVIDVMEETLLVDGVTVILNNGGVMDGGTHFHIHFIPRYKDDDFWTHQKVVEKTIDLHLLKGKLKEGVQKYENSSDYV